MKTTEEEFDEVIDFCRKTYIDKLADYGAVWRIMRTSSITDQIYIKAQRLRTLEINGEARVKEDDGAELSAIVNYCIMGLIQLELSFVDYVDLSDEQAVSLYDEKVASVRALMLAKNHDYGEAWRMMRSTSFTDIILMKLCRIKQLEVRAPQHSEGADSNYADILNYAVFALIRRLESECQNQ